MFLFYNIFLFSELGKEFGGYSGGFEDRGWACFSPSRTFSGPVGGLRSDLPVDKKQLRPYYHVKKIKFYTFLFISYFGDVLFVFLQGAVACVGPTAWNHSTSVKDGMVTFDFSTMEPGMIFPRYMYST